MEADSSSNSPSIGSKRCHDTISCHYPNPPWLVECFPFCPHSVLIQSEQSFPKAAYQNPFPCFPSFLFTTGCLHSDPPPSFSLKWSIIQLLPLFPPPPAYYLRPPHLIHSIRSSSSFLSLFLLLILAPQEEELFPAMLPDFGRLFLQISSRTDSLPSNRTSKRIRSRIPFFLFLTCSLILLLLCFSTRIFASYVVGFSLFPLVLWNQSNQIKLLE